MIGENDEEKLPFLMGGEGGGFLTEKGRKGKKKVGTD